MKRFVSLLGIVIITVVALFPRVCVAKSYKISILKSLDISPYNEAIEGFNAKLGFAGQEYDMEGDIRKGERYAEEILSEDPDIVVAVGTKATTILSAKINDIPIVFMMVSRPEKYLSNSNNITGVSLNPDPKDQFRILSQLLPKAKKIGVIYNGSTFPATVRRGLEAQESTGKKIVEVKVYSKTEIPEALREIRKQTDALWLVMDDMVITERSMRHIFKFSMKNNYPVIGFSGRVVKAGALFSSVPDFKAIGKQSAIMAKRIMQGEDPSNMPFLYPKSGGFVLNLITAKLLNIFIPAETRSNASKIYE